MRRQEADQIRTSLNTLEQAIDILQEYENRQNELLELLTQMQQMAISIGTEIEECEGEGLRVVSKLEELCEQFYQMGVNGDCKEQEKKAKEIIRLGKCIMMAINFLLMCQSLLMKNMIWRCIIQT